ncbi:unnamed protein product [Symbiodinium natans]|uniref:Uncharacterized protein n=1 Tax=Symbiodinium natans TaxID=878477 RepID=A0A812MJW4_9DINO|nr:unnamed protein product [Symbiodinium natans]
MARTLANLAILSRGCWRRTSLRKPHTSNLPMGRVDTSAPLFVKRAVASTPGTASPARTVPDSPSGAHLACWFGKKHYGRPLSQLVFEDPEYCRWLLGVAQEANASNALRESAMWLRLNAPHLQEKKKPQLVSGKKHRGEDLSKLVSEDPAYCQWILREVQEGDASPKLQEMAAWITDNAPHVQEQGLRVGGSKHYGRRISELVTEDPVFCQWVLRKAKEHGASHGVRDMADWLSKNAPHLKEAAFATGRKHYGQDMPKLVSEDPAYCQWILREAKEGEASPKLREMAAWITDNAPHVQEQGPLVGGLKHYGRRISELVTEDPVFCQWLLQKDKEGGACHGIRELATWLRENAPHLQEAGIAAGQKHRGRPMSEVLADDPAYCQWVIHQADQAEASPGLRDMADWLMANAPHLKAPSAALGQDRSARFLSRLVAEDPSYCQWLLRSAQEKKVSSEQQKQAEWLLKHAPHLKEMHVVRMKSVHRGIPLPQVVAEDPGWCRFVLGQPEAMCKEFAEVAEWLHVNAPELREFSEGNRALFTQTGKKMLEQHGRWFVVRYGKHRMKNFATVMEEDPEYVEWVEHAVKDGAKKNRIASKNYQVFAAFASQWRSKEQAVLASGAAEALHHQTAECTVV